MISLGPLSELTAIYHTVNYSDRFRQLAIRNEKCNCKPVTNCMLVACNIMFSICLHRTLRICCLDILHWSSTDCMLVACNKMFNICIHKTLRIYCLDILLEFHSLYVRGMYHNV